MAFYLMFPGWTPQEFSGTAQGDGSWLVTVTPANTDTVLPEEYGSACVFTNSGTKERKTIYVGTVWVSPDPTQPIAPTPAMILLGKFQQALSALSTGTVKSATIDGNSYSTKDMGELQKQIYVWQAQVNREMDQLKILQDQPVADKIVTEFRGPLGWPPTLGCPGLQCP